MISFHICINHRIREQHRTQTLKAYLFEIKPDHKPSIPSMVLQSCKAPYPTFIIISESWGTPSVHPPPFNESCIPSSHVASCTVLNWATVTKNGEVAQRLFVHENRRLSAPEDHRMKAHWGNGIIIHSAVARERIFDFMLGKSSRVLENWVSLHLKTILLNCF